MKKIIILLIAGIFVTGIQAQTRRYVKENENGTSWNNASGDIQLMMNELAETGGEVWVAKGSYVPAHIPGDGTTEEDKAFLMVKDVKLYGGFSGNESLPEQRDWKRNATILSGRLNEDQRAHHIVIAAGETGNACIDGFTITEGYAIRKDGEDPYLHINNEIISRGSGGGVHIWNASPILSNLIITGNQASVGGGISIPFNSYSILSNVTITDNHAGEGGGIFNGSILNISNSVISKNTASSEGGAYLPEQIDEIRWFLPMSLFPLKMLARLAWTDLPLRKEETKVTGMTVAGSISSNLLPRFPT